MELLPKELAEKLPRLSQVKDIDKCTAHIKYFLPDFSWTWYAAAYDGRDILWGLVDGFELEYGTFALSELRAMRGKIGCAMERDLYFEPRPLKEIYEQCE